MKHIIWYAQIKMQTFNTLLAIKNMYTTQYHVKHAHPSLFCNKDDQKQTKYASLYGSGIKTVILKFNIELIFSHGTARVEPHQLKYILCSNNFVSISVTFDSVVFYHLN